MRLILCALLLAAAGCCESHNAGTADAQDSGTSEVGDAPGLDAGEDGGGPCAPQDARFGTSCRPGVTRAVWDGSHCIEVEAGPGCECTGADCGSVYASVSECVGARRGCYAASCDPQPVSDSQCVACDGIGYLGAFWDGRGCFDLWGCECFGAGCALGFESLEECSAFYGLDPGEHVPLCPASQCEWTGGRWFPAAAGICGFVCGVPSADACAMDSCDCGAGRTFVSPAGCSLDASCGAAEACAATGGRWHPMADCFCGFTCGVPGACGACLDSCDCGPGRNVDALGACVGDPSCPPATDEQRCSFTGGIWRRATEGFCGFDCGMENERNCLVPFDACECGGLANFDASRGCVRDPACFLRSEGAYCGDGRGGWAICRAGLECSYPCGIPGCWSHCTAPCCPTDPTGCLFP